MRMPRPQILLQKGCLLRVRMTVPGTLLPVKVLEGVSRLPPKLVIQAESRR
jgi:hypothetical protein